LSLLIAWFKAKLGTSNNTATPCFTLIIPSITTSQMLSERFNTSIFCVAEEMCIIMASTQIFDGNLFQIHHMKNIDATLLHRKLNTHCIQEIFSSK
jgi:hypothetical protein